MTAIRRFRLSRFVAAVLAALGLLASSGRTLLACTMPGAEPASVEAEADPHAHHHAAAVPAAESMSEQAQRTQHDDAPPPQHERCPDLAHCAVMAWTPLPPVVPAVLAAPSSNVGSADARLMSVGRAIDTPPPKRG